MLKLLAALGLAFGIFASKCEFNQASASTDPTVKYALR